MKRIYFRALSLFLTLCIMLSFAPVSVSASDDSTITIDITVDYERAFELLDYINALRAEKRAPALVMTQGMLDAAVQRSAEIMVKFSKLRPDGDVCYNAYPYSGGLWFEEYQGAARSSDESWISYYKNDYLFQSDFKSAGVSVFTHNNKTYILIGISGLEGEPAVLPENAQAALTKEVDLGANSFDVFIQGESGMEAGALQELKLLQNNKDGRATYKTIWNNDSVSWTSSDPTVATVHDGVVTALSAGTAEITASAGANSATITITVTGEAAHAHTMEFVEGFAPTYYADGRQDYWHCTVCDRMYWDEAATSEVTAAELVIPKLTCDEHLWNEGVITVAPTSSVEGNKYFVCVNCGAEKNETVPVNGKTPMHSGELTRAKPTWQQLTDEIIAVSNTSARFVEGQEPSVTAPYKAGKVTDELLNTGLEYLNYVRYSACLPSVKLSEAWTDSAQHGAVVLGAIDELTHWPRQPVDMDKDFYNKGYQATSSSNISLRYNDGSSGNPFYSSIQGCMDDSSSWSNLSGVGHRRWLLDPTLNQVGLGYAHAVNGNTYITTKVFENGMGEQRGPDISYDFISWPASGNMTSNVFTRTAPWSISLNPKKYLTPDEETIHITLTRVADNTVWIFDKGTAGPDVHEKQYLALSPESYGSGDCIIFSPGSENIDLRYEGTYLVSVEGLQYLDGSPASIYYEVEFRSIRRCQHTNSVTIPAVPPSCESFGLTEGRECADCGEILEEQRSIPATGHSYDQITHVCGCGKVEAFTVTWMVDGEVYAATQQEYGMLVALPRDPYKQECEFIGWSTAAEGGEFVTAETVFNGTNAVVYYAQFTSISYPVCLFGNGGIVTDAFGNSNSQIDVNLKAGCDLTKLGDMGFVKDGYTFAGWKFFDITRKELDVTVMNGDVYYGRAQWKCAHETVMATDNGNGTHELTCTATCGETIATAEEHNFKNDAHTCICGVVCKHSDNVNVDDGKCNTSFACSVCNQVIRAAKGHTDAGGDGKCDACGDAMVKKLWGDVDGDGSVTTNDAMMVLQYAVGAREADTMNLDVCNVDGFGEIDTNDAMMILQYAVGTRAFFPVEE